jgi:CheY-like chemotaxis protein
MSSSGISSRRPHILCIDDAEVGLQVRKLIFEHAGYEVTTAVSGDEALHIFRNETIDVVIADHFLSDQTGTELAREMKELRPEVPILLVSAATDKPAGLEFVDGFLSKGEPPQTLLDAIARLLKSHRSAVTS